MTGRRRSESPTQFEPPGLCYSTILSFLPLPSLTPAFKSSAHDNTRLVYVIYAFCFLASMASSTAAFRLLMTSPEFSARKTALPATITLDPAWAHWPMFPGPTPPSTCKQGKGAEGSVEKGRQERASKSRHTWMLMVG